MKDIEERFKDFLDEYQALAWKVKELDRRIEDLEKVMEESGQHE